MTKPSPWRSTPAALRHRIATGWTLPRELVAAVRARAVEECRPASALAEEALNAYLEKKR